jgi:hypothetical protein
MSATGRARVAARVFARYVARTDLQLSELADRGIDVSEARNEVERCIEQHAAEIAAIIRSYAGFAVLDELMVAGQTRTEELRAIVEAVSP